MPRLIAKFMLDVAPPCLLAWPEGTCPELTVSIDSFDVTVRLRPADHWHSKAKNDSYWTTSIYAMDVQVSRNEPDSPPDVVITPDGKRDLTAQGTYLRSKLAEYGATAREISNRVLRFFQYSLGTPLVRPISAWVPSLHNPTWYDASGAELRGGTWTAVAEPVPGLRGELGAKKLAPNDASALVEYVKAPPDVSLAMTLLSDAQAAWFDGNLRRAVLELAICSEVMVKRRFFAQGSPAGAAFDYLEDKAKISVRVLELLDAVAEEAFFRSYRKEEPSMYQGIDCLFRCRNKIVHRGELAFRNDSGRTVQVDAAMVESWWHAVANVKRWLDALP